MRPVLKNPDRIGQTVFEWLSQIEMSESSGKETLQLLVNTTKQLKASVAQVTKQIRLMSKNNVYAENVKLLRSIPGWFNNGNDDITEVETITRFKNNDHFCSFIGLIPSTIPREIMMVSVI